MLEEKVDLTKLERVALSAGFAALGGSVAAGQYPIVGGYTALAGCSLMLSAGYTHSKRYLAREERLREREEQA